MPNRTKNTLKSNQDLIQVVFLYNDMHVSWILVNNIKTLLNSSVVPSLIVLA